MEPKLNCDCGFLYCSCVLVGCRCGHPKHGYKDCREQVENKATKVFITCPCPGVIRHYEIRKCRFCSDGCRCCRDGMQHLLVNICLDCFGKGVDCDCKTCLSDNGMPGKKEPGTCVLCHGDGEILDNYFEDDFEDEDEDEGEIEDDEFSYDSYEDEDSDDGQLV